MGTCRRQIESVGFKLEKHSSMPPFGVGVATGTGATVRYDHARGL